MTGSTSLTMSTILGTFTSGTDVWILTTTSTKKMKWKSQIGCQFSIEFTIKKFPESQSMMCQGSAGVRQGLLHVPDQYGEDEEAGEEGDPDPDPDSY